jgi:hypothetical protein
VVPASQIGSAAATSGAGEDETDACCTGSAGGTALVHAASHGNSHEIRRTPE